MLLSTTAYAFRSVFNNFFKGSLIFLWKNLYLKKNLCYINTNTITWRRNNNGTSDCIKADCK